MTDMDQARADEPDEPRCQVPSCPDFGDPDFGEATCPSWHADVTSSPVDAVGPAGPVGRSVGEVRADLAHCDRDGVPWPEAARRLLADVPGLLAEVERLTAALTEVGDGFDDLTDSWRAQFAQLTAVEGLVEQARKVSPSASMTVYVGDLEKALGRRADSVRGIVGASS